jgi:integrase
MLSRVKRKHGPDCWAFRWWDIDASGMRVRRTKTLGSVREYPTETSAMKAVEALRITINEEQPESKGQPVTVGALINHFKQHELGPIEKEEEEEGRSYSTRITYIDILDTYVLPKWADVELRKVRTTQVEKWLRKLKRAGKSKGNLARGSKAKVRSVMSVLFNHAIRHELMPQGSNPITMVRQSAKRMQIPDVLEVVELRLLFGELSHRERVMVLLDAITGFRRSELMALKWLDVDFEQLEISVTRSIYRQVVGRCKTEISRKPVPLDPWIAEELLTWKRATPYNQPEDWVFASTRMKGEQPYSPDSLLKRQIRPAVKRAKILKHVGWHTFRRTFSTLLKANGEDIKTVQELLRHATIKMTLEVYAQAVTPAKRQAQSKVAGMLKEKVGEK